MRKILSIAIAFAMLSTLVPAAEAHTSTGDYDIPSGPNGNRGTALSTRLCASEWDNWDEGIFSDSGDETVFGPAGFGADDSPDDTIVGPGMTTAFTTTCSSVRSAWEEDGFKMGVFSGGLAAPTDSYTSFVASVSDDNFDSTFINVCVFTGGDNSCQTDDTSPTFDDPDGQVDYAASGCGSVSVQTNGELGGGPENGAGAFVYATYVDAETLEICLGSSGTLTIVMS